MKERESTREKLISSPQPDNTDQSPNALGTPWDWDEIWPGKALSELGSYVTAAYLIQWAAFGGESFETQVRLYTLGAVCILTGLESRSNRLSFQKLDKVAKEFIGKGTIKGEEFERPMK